MSKRDEKGYGADAHDELTLAVAKAIDEVLFDPGRNSHVMMRRAADAAIKAYEHHKAMDALIRGQAEKATDYALRRLWEDGASK